MSQPTPRPTAPRSRTRPWLIGGGVAVLLAAALAGATAVTSAQTERQVGETTKQVQGLLDQSGYGQYVHIESERYVRGLGSSTQTLVLALGPQDDPLRLRLVSQIQHGPLPGLRQLGQDVIDTRIGFADAALQQRMLAALHGGEPRLHTVIGLDGAVHSTLSVPAGSYTEGSTALTWQALGGTLLRAGGGQTSVAMSWPGAQLSAPDGRGSVSGLRLLGQSSGGPDGLGASHSDFSVDTLQYQDKGGSGLRLNRLSVRSDGGAAQGFYHLNLRYGVGDLQAEGLSLQNLTLALSASHLAEAPLKRLSATLQQLSRSQGSSGASMNTLSAAQKQALEQDGQALLRAGPVLALDTLSVRLPSGTLALDARLSLPDPAKLDLQTLGDHPEALLGAARLVAHLRADEAALRQLLSGEQGLSESLDALVQQGYARRAGGKLSTELLFQSGRGTLNGQSLDRLLR